MGDITNINQNFTGFTLSAVSGTFHADGTGDGRSHHIRSRERRIPMRSPYLVHCSQLINCRISPSRIMEATSSLLTSSPARPETQAWWTLLRGRGSDGWSDGNVARRGSWCASSERRFPRVLSSPNKFPDTRVAVPQGGHFGIPSDLKELFSVEIVQPSRIALPLRVFFVPKKIVGTGDNPVGTAYYSCQKRRGYARIKSFCKRLASRWLSPSLAQCASLGISSAALGQQGPSMKINVIVARKAALLTALLHGIVRV